VTEYAVPYTLGGPTAIAVGPDGALWFPTDDSLGIVGRIPTAGAITQYSAPGLFGVGIVSGPDGALWLAGYNGAIGRLMTKGAFTSSGLRAWHPLGHRFRTGPSFVFHEPIHQRAERQYRASAGLRLRHEPELRRRHLDDELRC
jgi:virginiamycin B lyase